MIRLCLVQIGSSLISGQLFVPSYMNSATIQGVEGPSSHFIHVDKHFSSRYFICIKIKGKTAMVLLDV